ncbi:MAG: peptidyl-prolyl cis-trans isomerase [Azoarcus sp.]|jgi:peptidyl-prolyl cis-trans isomerase A (cyclophilin A)|nr:peptidyl-prolyl cis-trans isomerase [Azoarcus sp.]
MIRYLLASLAFGLCILSAHAANPQPASRNAATPAPVPVVKPLVKLQTSKGDIVLELNIELAPVSTANFLQYVRDGHYDGTIFHRVIDGFMVQGGGMDQNLNEKQPRAPIENEAGNGLKNEAGTVAMARTSAPHSATAQFFINVADNAFLDYPGQDGWGYAVFGRVVKGMDVVREIAKARTKNAGMHSDVPVEPVTIESAQVLEAAAQTEAARSTPRK